MANKQEDPWSGHSKCHAVGFTLKKVFPWLASSESDLGLFLLYNAYIPNWSFCNTNKHILNETRALIHWSHRAVAVQDLAIILPFPFVEECYCRPVSTAMTSTCHMGWAHKGLVSGNWGGLLSLCIPGTMTGTLACPFTLSQWQGRLFMVALYMVPMTLSLKVPQPSDMAATTEQE